VAVDLSRVASLPGVQAKVDKVVSPSAGVVSIWKPLAAPSAPLITSCAPPDPVAT
jgi:hypothetical protein